MRNYEQYKRIVKFIFSIIVLSLEMIIFLLFCGILSSDRAKRESGT